MPAFAQSGQPPWPQIHLSACPSFTPQQNSAQKIWKHGQAEKDAFQAALAAYRNSDWKQAAEASSTFVSHYPDSDYRVAALVIESVAYAWLKDTQGEVEVAEQMVTVPSAAPNIRYSGFVTLCDSLTPFVRPNDPQLDEKLGDLAQWAKCGRAAFDAAGPPPKGTGHITRSVLTGTEGFVALMRKDYSLASERLEKAVQLNPQYARAYLWLVEAKAFETPPDGANVNAALRFIDRNETATVFYQARVAYLLPQNRQAEKLLEEIYKIDHGSMKGLGKLKALAQTNTVPPVGFTILPKVKKKNQRAAAIAGAAIIGLLAYAAVSSPSTVAGISSAVGGGREPWKLMIFGGPGHSTYLGCLNCAELATDSVFNGTGRYGSPLGRDSVSNSYGEYGSPYSTYSACNPNATDPPVIVDENGNAYGRLTVNRYAPNIGAGARFYGWLVSSVCRQ